MAPQGRVHVSAGCNVKARVSGQASLTNRVFQELAVVVEALTALIVVVITDLKLIACTLRRRYITRVFYEAPIRSKSVVLRAYGV